MEIMRSDSSVGMYWRLDAMEFLTTRPTFDRRIFVVNFSELWMVRPSPWSLRRPSSGKRTTLRAEKSIFYRDSSCAMRPERRTGRLLSVMSNIVLILRHATV